MNRVPSLFFVVAAACTADAPVPLEVGDEIPSFALTDVNPNSESFERSVGITPSGPTRVTVWYFAHADCAYCSAQFGALDELYAELDEDGVLTTIAGINETGLEEHNNLITEGRTIPWLQDERNEVWNGFGAQWRDIFVVDVDGFIVDKQNLTELDLTVKNTRDVFGDSIRAVVELAADE